jgi:hypothetical protein
MVRLLAYGGNAFVERRRFGRWPSIPEGILGDYYGLSPHGMVFGCGVSGDHLFLIWRSRQNVQNRGGYPYTLLIDPGLDAWRAFGNNAAALLQAMLADAPLRAGLVDDVDRITLDWLECSLGALRPVDCATAPARGDAAALWMLSAAARSMLVFGGAMPDVETCARWLAALPPCFRVAGGWLVSGCLPHAEAYGARLVFEPEFGAPPDAGQIGRGASMLRRWRAAEAHPELGAAVRMLSQIPAEWWGAPVTAVFEHIERRHVASLEDIARVAEERVGNAGRAQAIPK